MALYDGIENVGDPRHPFLTNAENYELSLVSIKTGKNFKDKREYLKATVEVINSAGPEALAPGTTATIKIDEEVQYGYHKKDIRNLIAAIAALPEDQITGAVVAEILAADNPAKGTHFFARRGPVPSADGSKTFTKTEFADKAFPVSEPEPVKGKAKK